MVISDIIPNQGGRRRNTFLVITKKIVKTPLKTKILTYGSIYSVFLKTMYKKDNLKFRLIKNKRKKKEIMHLKCSDKLQLVHFLGTLSWLPTIL